MAITTWAFQQQLASADLNSTIQSIIAMIFPPAKYSTASITGVAFAAGQLTGAQFTVFINSNASPGTCTTRTATQMFGDFTNATATTSYLLRLVQTGAGTMTLGAGTGVTLTGTMTIAQNTWRDFIVSFTSATTLTITSIGTGTYS